MIDYKKLTKDCIQWIREWFAVNGPKSPAVLGISGGKDSTIAAKLCVEALGADRVIGVTIPGEGQDTADAEEVAKILGIKLFTVPIDDVAFVLNNYCISSMSPYQKEIEKAPYFTNFSESSLKRAQQNLPPRLRMCVLYFISQFFDGRVVGTCNLSENFIGYFTIHGDGASDMEPLANLTVTEIRHIGEVLGLPKELVWKTPEDGLPHSQPDEEKFGFSYKHLDEYIRTGNFFLGDGEKKPDVDKIRKMHVASQFKRNMVKPPMFMPSRMILNYRLSEESGEPEKES